MLMGEVPLHTKGRPKVLFSEPKIWFERRVSEHVINLVDLFWL